MFSGIRAIHPSANSSRPHVLGFSTARTVADDTLLEVWNAATNAGRRLTLDLNGFLKLWGTRSAIALVDGITAPATVAGYAIIYVDTADGDAKIKFGDGFVGTLSVDS